MSEDTATAAVEKPDLFTNQASKLVIEFEVWDPEKEGIPNKRGFCIHELFSTGEFAFDWFEVDEETDQRIKAIVPNLGTIVLLSGPCVKQPARAPCPASHLSWVG